MKRNNILRICAMTILLMLGVLSIATNSVATEPPYVSTPAIGDFVWNDLGSWDQVYKLTSQDNDGNAALGNALTIESKNCYVSSDSGVVAVLGMEDVVVVRDGDAVLVCKRHRSEDVRQIVERLKREKLNDYI